MTALAVFTLILWFGLELAFDDLSRPEPVDPYRWARWNDDDPR